MMPEHYHVCPETVEAALINAHGFVRDHSVSLWKVINLKGQFFSPSFVYQYHRFIGKRFPEDVYKRQIWSYTFFLRFSLFISLTLFLSTHLIYHLPF